MTEARVTGPEAIEGPDSGKGGPSSLAKSWDMESPSDDLGVSAGPL